MQNALDANAVLMNIESMRTGITDVEGAAQVVQVAIAEVNKHFAALQEDRYNSEAASNLRTQYHAKTKHLQSVYDHLMIFRQDLQAAMERTTNAARARGIAV